MSAERKTYTQLPSDIEVDREYVEAYPLNWEVANQELINAISTSRSHPGLDEISVYIHNPFCQKVCPFCNFNVIEYDGRLYKGYLNALNAELQMYRDHPDITGRKVTAIYFGGGTGSMLRPGDVDMLLKGVSDIFAIDPAAEITVECHPNTVGERRFKEYQSVGVNRVTLGIQSFDDVNLTAIGRDHTADQNRRILTQAKNTGFKNVGMDLMYRLPHQDIGNLARDLETIAEYAPDTVSAYSLESDETALSGEKSKIPSDAVDREMFYLVGDYLKASGYARYMQPDFALPGKECRYVVNAWQAPQKLLLGLGAGANTHYFGGHSWTNVYPVTEYIKALNSGCSPIVSGSRVDHEELKAKYMVLGVRGINIDKSNFERLFGEAIVHKFGLQIAGLISKGWLQDKGDIYEVTRQGLPYINNISKVFYTAQNNGRPQPWYNDIHTFIPKKFYKIGER